mgnify:CR=1 FL=1
MKSILRIKRVNWGLHSDMDWDEIRYLLYPNGSYKISAKNGRKEIMKEYSISGKFSNDKLNATLKLINEFNKCEPSIRVDACDGEGFEITTYNEEGCKMGYRALGYVYGIDTIEQMVKMFDEDL